MNEPMNKPAAAPLAGQVKAKVEPIIANTEALAKAQQANIDTKIIEATSKTYYAPGKGLHPAERIPSNWSIRSTGDDSVEAYCNATGTRFEGTIEELNQRFFR